MPFDPQPELEEVRLLVPGMKCAGCMSRIERRLQSSDGVFSARANLSNRTVRAEFDPSLTGKDALLDALASEGYPARPFDPSLHGKSQTDREGRDLLLRLGVAGFAAMNVMLLSISVWSGAEAATRDLLHWVSALIALPAIAYAVVPFVRSAWNALSARRMNMDVPISLAVLLAAGHSIAETMQGGEHAYFDAGITLLFFLLIGRYLEHHTRSAARSAAAELLAMTGREALRVMPDGARHITPLEDLAPGMVIEVAPGERLPADGTIIKGETELDRSLVTGESLPDPAAPGDDVHAGFLNLTGMIQVTVTATGEATLLADIARMVDAAERGRGRYDRIADRAARIYAPAVHVVAAAAFLGWYLLSGELRTALQVAVAVLIVTCPCALALAVPTVHTVASSRLFRQGIFLKDGAELERLAEIDTVAFDKTGTLTTGEPKLTDGPADDDPAWPVAAGLALHSHHPLSRAIAAEAERRGIAPAVVEDCREQPGLGVSGTVDGSEVRLGRASWAGASGSGVALSMPGRTVSFTFEESLREGAQETCTAMASQGLDLAILSGDHATAVSHIGRELNIGERRATLLPGEKLGWLKEKARQGHKVLMVGDGLNDGPALAAAHASISPASAVDVAKTAAGFVFTGDSLRAVAEAYAAARTAKRRALQSFGIALCYNLVAVPLAAAGYITPLTAALAMSSSSILVVLNALRKEKHP